MIGMETMTTIELDTAGTIDQLRMSTDGEGTRTLIPSATLNFKEIITAADLGTDEIGRDAYLNRHERLIEDLLEVRYGAEKIGEDWETCAIEFMVSLPPGDYDVEAIIRSACAQPSIARFSRDCIERDSGGLGRQIVRFVSECTSAVNPLSARAQARRMSTHDISAMVEDRHGCRQLSDGCALAIAASFGAGYPGLRALSATGYARTADLHRDLNELTGLHSGNRSILPQLEMMFSWILAGGDNT